MNLALFLKDYGSLCVATLAAIFAVLTYRKNAKTRRAEFLVQLHKAFFVEEKYQNIRRVLDSADESAGSDLFRLIDEESEELIDFLKFFEFNAYLEKCGNISSNDLNAGLGYYLKLLKRRTSLRRYIMAHENSFEHLRALLGKIR